MPGTLGSPSALPLDPVIERRRPLLATLLQERGQESLATFAANNMRDLPLPSPARQKELLDVVEALLEARIGREHATKVREQLTKHYFLSSADHHGPLNGSLYVSSNAWLAAGLHTLHDPALRYACVLSCASVSQNNEDYARGLLFHMQQGSAWMHHELPILPSSQRMSVVYGNRAWNAEEIVRARKVLASSTPSEKIDTLLATVYGAPNVLQHTGLTEQVTALNLLLWKKLWDADVPDLVSLDMESLTSALLVAHHCTGNSPLHTLLFTPQGTLHLRGLLQAMAMFLRQGEHPTDLFWGRSENGRRVRLVRVGNRLASADDSISVLLEPTAIADALQTQHIFPNLFLCFTVLHLYYGLNCSGGFNQMHYLDAMQRLYRQSGIDAEAPTPRSALYQFGPDLLFLDSTTPAYALDIALHEAPGAWARLEAMLQQMTLAEAFGRSSHIVASILSETDLPTP